MFAPTTDRSSSPRRYAIGSLPSALKRPTSSLANPWGNGYWQSFNSKLRDELLNGETFFSLAEAQVLIEAWRRHFNAVRPHSALEYRPPAPEAVIPRSGNIVPWTSAPALEGVRSPNPSIASGPPMN